MLGAVGVVALVMSGCANSDESAESSDGPLKVMVIQSMTGTTGVDDTAPKGAQAAADAVNAKGGVNGRKIEVLSCDTASDPNKATECARKALSEKVVAVVGSFDPIGVTGSLPVLESAGIPSIAPLAIFAAEFSNPVSFPVTGGAPAGQFGMVQVAADAQCKEVALLGDKAADQGQVERMVDAVKAQGMEGFYVNLPLNTADVTPMIAQVNEKNPDCVAYANGAMGVRIFGGLRKAGSDAQFISATGSLLPPYLKALGKDAEGILATSETFNIDAPELKPFQDDMKKYQPDVSPIGFTLYGWYGVTAFAQVADKLDEVNSSTVLAALNKTADLRLPGLNPVDFTKDRDSKIFPRMFNAEVRYNKVQDGRYVPSDEEWHDVGAIIP